MLALIIPPILVVLALALLLYLFFRKLPEVERREREQTGSSGSLLSVSDRFKRMFLGMVERFARLSKLLSLKIHNKLNTLAASAHSARVRVADRIAERKQDRLDQMKMNVAPFESAPKKSLFERSSKQLTEKELDSHSPLPTQPHRPRRWFGTRRSDNDRSPADTFPSSLPGEAVSNENFESGEDLPPLVSEPLQPIPEQYPDRRARSVPSYAGRTLRDTVRRLRPARVRTASPSREIEPTVPQKKEQLEDILVERISLNPRDIEAYERLGDYYLEQQNLVDAKECYRQVLKLSPAYRLVKIKIRKLERLLEKDRTP
ncbi:MAG: tetratricopeptide repeat protein [Candidatus Moraniibacteriota bacterium]|nr:MAG: tetratricopeptide repeat protein [Candidatus Moranbacteria bacterium]